MTQNTVKHKNEEEARHERANLDSVIFGNVSCNALAVVRNSN
jgi:hypothetical protein